MPEQLVIRPGARLARRSMTERNCRGHSIPGCALTQGDGASLTECLSLYQTREDKGVVDK